MMSPMAPMLRGAAVLPFALARIMYVARFAAMIEMRVMVLVRPGMAVVFARLFC